MSNLDLLKSAARGRLAAKFNDLNAKRQWRDQHVARNYLTNCKSNRKDYALLIRSIIQSAKPNPDKMRLLAALQDFDHSHPYPTDWFYSVLKRQFGENVRPVWKSDWIYPVWQNESWFRKSPWSSVHKVHQSEDNPEMIAYNRSIDNIRRDIQTRTKPGKYLTQFFSDVLTQDEIRTWAEKQVANASLKADLKFIENNDPSGWVRVYEDGPSSCMKGDECVKVYAYEGNGLRLAYLDSDGSIVARAIVRDDEKYKGYVRIYPNDCSTEETRWNRAMKSMLAEVGYTEQTNLNGVKIKRIDDHRSNSVMCPYIDMGDGGPQDFDLYEDYLLICNGGEFGATNTSGWVELESGEECDDCGSREDEDDMNYIEYCDRRVCQHCLDNNYTYAYGRRYQDYYPNDDVIYCESDGEWYVTEYASNHDVCQCRSTGDWYHIDDMVTVDKGNYEGDLVHTDQAERDEVTDTYWCTDDMTWVDGKYVPDEFVGTCHITGNSFDTRFGVALEIGQKRSYYGTPFMHTIYVSPDAWNLDIIRENFVRCGDLLLPRGYYGNEINNVEEPSNIEYGDEFDGDKFEDIFVEEAEELLAA